LKVIKANRKRLILKRERQLVKAAKIRKIERILCH
jgi:hypothetical protein